MSQPFRFLWGVLTRLTGIKGFLACRTYKKAYGKTRTGFASMDNMQFHAMARLEPELSALPRRAYLVGVSRGLAAVFLLTYPLPFAIDIPPA
ncbi:MAG TPA: hypothetical protein EYP31_10620 [Roseibacterium sp.]|nr:hypothetical protein [Roseibacterium sp.]